MIHSYVIVLVVMLKTIKILLHSFVSVLLYAEVLNQKCYYEPDPCGTLFCAVCLLLRLSNTLFATVYMAYG